MPIGAQQWRYRPGEDGCDTTYGTSDRSCYGTHDADRGVVAADPGVSIRVLPPEEYPEAFAAARELPGTVLYSMEPDGLKFDAPARVTRRIPVANFGDLSPMELGFEQLANARILRSGDSIFVSGDTTHFSPLVGVSQQVTIEVRLAEVADGSARELGFDWQMDWLFEDPAGIPLNAPSVTAMAADSDLETMVDGPSFLFKCEGEGEFDSQFRWVMEAAPPSTSDPTVLALRITPSITGTDRIELELGVDLNTVVLCAPPPITIVGLSMSGDFLVDHPGGQVIITNEAFRGGLSGLLGRVLLHDAPPLDLPIHSGLIQDRNNNGVVALKVLHHDRRRTRCSMS